MRSVHSSSESHSPTEAGCISSTDTCVIWIRASKRSATPIVGRNSVMRSLATSDFSSSSCCCRYKALSSAKQLRCMMAVGWMVSPSTPFYKCRAFRRRVNFLDLEAPLSRLALVWKTTQMPNVVKQLMQWYLNFYRTYLGFGCIGDPKNHYPFFGIFDSC